MKTLILVSKTPIVIQIFNLICKKLSISLEVLSETQIDHKVDIIVIDKNMIDDRFAILKTYCKLIGAISNEELPFEMANDFLIPLPFLPSVLENILQEQLQELAKRAKAKTYITNIEQPLETLSTSTQDEAKPATDYLEDLASNIAQDVKDDFDDSIVHASIIEDVEGGILDQNELLKLETLVETNTTSKETTTSYSYDETTETEDEWMDLSSIIDKAIDEVNSNENFLTPQYKEPIKILLNNYSMEQLKPLFELLNQDIIDTLADGQEVLLELKLETNK